MAYLNLLPTAVGEEAWYLDPVLHIQGLPVPLLLCHGSCIKSLCAMIYCLVDQQGASQVQHGNTQMGSPVPCLVAITCCDGKSLEPP